MKYLELSTGDQIPALGLGTWKSNKGEVYQAVRKAIEIGYSHFDCAAIYGNEREIGNALNDAMNAGEVKREELWVTSKLWNTSHQKDKVQPALEKTLERLQLSYLDLYLMHWPIAIKQDAPFPFLADAFISLEEIPLEETWQAMIKLQQQGLAKNIGVANFSIKKIIALKQKSGFKPAVNQIEMHPFLQQNKMVEFCKKEGIVLTTYSPLGSRDRPETTIETPNLLTDKTLAEIAEKLGNTPAQVLIKWSIQMGNSVIPKSVNNVRLQENFESLQVQLSEKDMTKIAALERNFRYVDGSFFTPKGSPYTLANLWDEK